MELRAGEESVVPEELVADCSCYCAVQSPKFGVWMVEVRHLCCEYSWPATVDEASSE